VTLDELNAELAKLKPNQLRRAIEFTAHLPRIAGPLVGDVLLPLGQSGELAIPVDDDLLWDITNWALNEMPARGRGRGRVPA
jgi:hypothetical protein